MVDAGTPTSPAIAAFDQAIAIALTTACRKCTEKDEGCNYIMPYDVHYCYQCGAELDPKNHSITLTRKRALYMFAELRQSQAQRLERCRRPAELHWLKCKVTPPTG